MKTMRRRGFTLIELLTVMAISAILLGLIIVPLIQSFNLTRTAQAFAEAQDRARIVTERISREIGNAAMVRGAGGVVRTVINDPAATAPNLTVPANTLIVRVPRGVAGRWPGNADNPIEVALPFTKIDMYRPAEGSPVRGPGGAFVDPVTGKEDPTLQAPKGQVNLPGAPGMVLVRYWVGLRDPLGRYNNPYDGLLMARNGQRDNLYGLYRAEIVPFLVRNHKNTPNDDTTRAWRPNLEYFVTDDTDTQIIDPQTQNAVGLDDPRFFTATADNAGNLITNDVKADRIRNWQRRATLMTDVSRYDMILPVYDRGSRAVQPVAGSNVMPRIVPLVQFRPTRINSDPAEPMLATRPGEESDAAASVGSDVYMTQYGLWGNVVVRVFPRRWSFAQADENDYLVAHRSMTNPDKPMSLYAYDPNGGPDYLNGPNRELFDIALYDRLSVERGRPGSRVYPFTQAVAAANANSGWLSNAAFRQLFTPFTFDRNRGRVLTSFGIDDVGDFTRTPTNARNLPEKAIGPELTPATDTDLTGNFYDPKFASINKLYNKLFNDYPWLRAGNVHRFIDLRLVPNSDGTPSPLFPGAVANTATGFVFPTEDGGMRSKVSIVPGSEVVFGPDQLPGPNYGSMIRYTRVTRGNPGPNQYRLNYADTAEPTNDSGTVDYSVAFPDAPADQLAAFNPRVYNPQNLISAVLQPRYKAGYLQLYSGSDLPMPQGDGVIRVYYRFQFTGSLSGSERPRNGLSLRADVSARDTIAVDYDTRQLLDVLLTIRNFPQASVPNPQTVTLKSTATVRNYTR
jgi:prepilin-type N-terminal cleavage/methylation domain-containing protein